MVIGEILYQPETSGGWGAWLKKTRDMRLDAVSHDIKTDPELQNICDFPRQTTLLKETVVC